jgi:dGTPase
MPLQTRLQWEMRERAILAPFAQFSCQSRGRTHPEPVHVFRPEFQRDRIRIVHSASFRRLEYKTQAVLNGSGDRFRTRLSHTLESASLARVIARTLALNEDLAEAVALARDLGHPPFGQAGGHTLNTLMRDHGGFHHGRQSLRIVEDLETGYPEFNGLNLSWETREGLVKHQAGHAIVGNQPGLEAQCADAADEIAYAAGDLADALENGLIDPPELDALQIWNQVNLTVRSRYARLDPERARPYILHHVANSLIEDLCLQSAHNLDETAPADADAARTCPRRLVGFSLALCGHLQQLRDFLRERFHYNPRISGINQRACRVLHALFEFFHRHPHLVDDRCALRIKKEGVARAVCDYVAGLTDQDALRLYARHIGTDDLLRELQPGD